MTVRIVSSFEHWYDIHTVIIVLKLSSDSVCIDDEKRCVGFLSRVKSWLFIMMPSHSFIVSGDRFLVDLSAKFWCIFIKCISFFVLSVSCLCLSASFNYGSSHGICSFVMIHRRMRYPNFVLAKRRPATFAGRKPNRKIIAKASCTPCWPCQSQQLKSKPCVDGQWC